MAHFPWGDQMTRTDTNREETRAHQPTEAQELTSLIQKFRWEGRDEEAEIMCARLTRLSKNAIVLSEPRETD